MKRRTFLTALAALSLPAIAAPANKRMTLVTYPGTGKADIPTREFVAGIAPLKRDIELATGQSLTVSLQRNIKDFNRAAAAGSRAPALAYGPATSAAIYMNAGYHPLARVVRQATGMIVSKLPLDRVQSVAFPDPESWLAQAGEYTVEVLTKRTFVYHYAKTQDAAVEAMKYGLADAVAIRPNTLKKLQEMDPAYQVIAHLPKTPDFTFLAHPNVDDFAQATLKNALLSLSETTIASLDKVYHVKLDRFTLVSEDEYDDLRRIIATAKRMG